MAAAKAKAQAEEAANAKARQDKAAEEAANAKAGQDKAVHPAQQAKEVKMAKVNMAPQGEKAKVRTVAGKGTGGGVAAKQVVSAQEMREEETVERKKAAAEHKRKELEAKVASLRKLLREESKGSKIVKEDGLQALPSSLRASDPKAPAPVATAAAPAAPAAKTSVSGNKEAARTVKVLASGAAKAGSAREDHTSAQALKEALKVANACNACVLEKSSP